MDSAKQAVLKLLKEGGDVLPKLMKLIEANTIPDPKGIIKEAALYGFEQKHDFRAVCHFIERWQKLDWARGFLARMQNRLNMQSVHVSEDSLIPRLRELSELYLAQSLDRKMAIHQYKMAESMNRMVEPAQPAAIPLKASRFKFNPSAVPVQEKPIKESYQNTTASYLNIIPETKPSENIAEKPLKEKPKLLKETPTNLDYVMEQRLRRKELSSQQILPADAVKLNEVLPTKVSFMPQLPELPKVYATQGKTVSPVKQNIAMTKTIFGGQRNTFTHQSHSDANESFGDLSFSLSPAPKKQVKDKEREKEALIRLSAGKLISQVEEELSAVRPKKPQPYAEPDPNELYSRHAKEQLEELHKHYRPYILQPTIWQRLQAEQKLSILPEVIARMEDRFRE